MGKAFVDDVHEPTAFEIRIGPFLYFAGDATSDGGRAMLEKLTPYRLLMPSAPGWVETAKATYGERLAGFPRYSFSSVHVSVERLDHLCRASAFREDVRQMDLPFATQLWGREHCVDFSDFDSAEDFVRRGVGFYLNRQGMIAGAAYSSLVCSRGIEVSVFVTEDHRRKGVATVLACRLLQWCMQNNAQANWDAANPESCKLAEKLGYIQTGEYRAYYLKAE